MRPSFAFIVVAALVMILSTAASGGDWPQWRGAEHTGIAEAGDFNADFASGGRVTVAWQRDVGIGYSPVTVADGRAYTAGWRDGRDTVYCFDARSGEPIWTSSYPIDRFNRQHEGGPSDAIAVADGRAFHFTRDGRLFCFDAATGDVQWERDIAGEYGVSSPRWAFAGSPIVVDGVLYLEAGRVLALDVADGRERWKTADFGAAYSTPMPFRLRGRDLLAAFPESGLVIVSRDDGRVVAQHGWQTRYGVNAVTPIVAGDKVFISSGYNTGCALLQLTDAGLQLVWESRVMRNQLPTCVLIDGYLYGFDDRQLKCVAFDSGEQMWAERGLGQGTLIAAGDTLIVMSDTGELMAAPASPNGFEPVTRVTVFEGQNLWVSPALADGLLYCRTPQGELVCIDTSGR